jgi:hypothetical protein
LILRNLYGVTEERALNFWAAHLQDEMGSARWAQIRDSTGVYLASVLGHFCLQSVDRLAVLSGRLQSGRGRVPAVCRPDPDCGADDAATDQREESAVDGVGRRAHSAVCGILPEPEPASAQHRVLATMGRDCYLMAAVGKREKMMKLMAAEFGQYLFHLANVHRNLRESRYLIRAEE